MCLKEYVLNIEYGLIDIHFDQTDTYLPPVPQWVWIYAAIIQFTAHTLDGIDGKQARRTGTSSPLGMIKLII